MQGGVSPRQSGASAGLSDSRAAPFYRPPPDHVPSHDPPPLPALARPRQVPHQTLARPRGIFPTWSGCCLGLFLRANFEATILRRGQKSQRRHLHRQWPAHLGLPAARHPHYRDRAPGPLNFQIVAPQDRPRLLSFAAETQAAPAPDLRKPRKRTPDTHARATASSSCLSI